MALALATTGVLAVHVPASAVPAGWSGPTRVFATSTMPRHAMVIDGNGKTHIATEDGSSGIVYVTNAGGSWQECRVSSGDDREPSITLGGDLVHIAFARRSGEVGIYTASGAGAGGGGCGWPVEKRHAGNDTRPSIAAFGLVLHLAFRGGGKLRYLRGASDATGWSIHEVVDGTCCQSAPALALTSDGSPRIAYGDISGDGLKYAARSGSSWNKRRVQRGRILHVALVLDYTPDPWNGLQPANAPNIAYVVKRVGTYAAGKGGSGVSGSWWISHLGRYFTPPDLSVQSNKSVIIFGQGGQLWAQSRQGGITIGKRISRSGKDGYPQIALYGVDSVVTFSRGQSGEGVYRTAGYL